MEEHSDGEANDEADARSSQQLCHFLRAHAHKIVRVLRAQRRLLISRSLALLLEPFLLLLDLGALVANFEVLITGLLLELLNLFGLLRAVCVQGLLACLQLVPLLNIVCFFVSKGGYLTLQFGFGRLLSLIVLCLPLGLLLLE